MVPQVKQPESQGWKQVVSNSQRGAHRSSRGPSPLRAPRAFKCCPLAVSEDGWHPWEAGEELGTCLPRSQSWRLSSFLGIGFLPSD